MLQHKEIHLALSRTGQGGGGVVIARAVIFISPLDECLSLRTSCSMRRFDLQSLDDGLMVALTTNMQLHPPDIVYICVYASLTMFGTWKKVTGP